MKPPPPPRRRQEQGRYICARGRSGWRRAKWRGGSRGRDPIMLCDPRAARTAKFISIGDARDSHAHTRTHSHLGHTERHTCAIELALDSRWRACTLQRPNERAARAIWHDGGPPPRGPRGPRGGAAASKGRGGAVRGGVRGWSWPRRCLTQGLRLPCAASSSARPINVIWTQHLGQMRWNIV